MWTALIPPIPDQQWAAVSRIQMSLNHLFDDEAYGDIYTRFYEQRAELGDYVILDNGAHANDAGKPATIEELIERADQIGAHEIVLPDVQGDGQATLDLLKPGLQAAIKREDFSYMFVPQGRTFDEWKDCFSIGTHACWIGDVEPVIGVAKHHDETCGGIDRLVNFIARNSRLEIHLLGWPRNKESLNIVAQRFGSRVRSVDSAKPFVYAKVGLRLDQTDQHEPRDVEYFEDAIPVEDRPVISHNINVFRQYAAGAA